LATEHTLEKDQLLSLLTISQREEKEYLFKKARALADKVFEKKIYVRGLIEFTNYCRNDCYYCGIRKSNLRVERYRLSKEQILDCCQTGYRLGFRTFVLQGGEDPGFSQEALVDIISTIRNTYFDCAITLSIGEKSYEQYQELFRAGANRYLLRHETANKEHYTKLHPPGQKQENRLRCLSELKKIGYQVGAGFMVGSPYQTGENLVEDLLFLKEFQPEMIGVGPFIPHQDTPFKNCPRGDLDLTLILISILRLMLPNAMIPATTALGTIHPQGRELGILAGANVLMPNLSPIGVRKKYLLYDNKICTDEEAVEGFALLKKRIQKIGYELVTDRGDFRKVI